MIKCSRFALLLVILCAIDDSAADQGVASVVVNQACEVFSSPGTFLAYQGEDRKTLTCNWSGSSAVKEFTWTLNGENFTDADEDRTQRNSQRIVLHRLTDAHSGVIRCTVLTEDDQTGTAHLTMQLQGSLPVIVPSTTQYLYDNTVTLNCSHSIINVTQITWMEDDRSLFGLNRAWVTFSGDETYSESISVHLRNGETVPPEKYVCWVHSKYSCRGFNNMMRTEDNIRQSNEVQIDIKYPIELSLSTTEPEVFLDVNEDFNVSCTHHKGNDPVTIKWYKYTEDGTKRPVSELDTVQVVPLSSKTHLLKFYKAKPYVSGIYRCEGWNSYGKDVKNISVNVQNSHEHGGSLKNIILASTSKTGVGTRFELVCYDSNIDFDNNNLEWYRDDIVLHQPHDSYIYSDSKLIIPRLKKSDQGSYYCRYTDKNHPIKFYSDSYQLRVIDFPPKPINVTVLGNETTENSLLVQWSYSQDVDTVATSVIIEADFSNNAEANPDSRVENTIQCSPEEGCPDQYTLRGLAPGTRYNIVVTAVNRLGQTGSDVVRHTTNISQQLKENTPDEYVMKLVVGCVAGVFVLMCALGYIFFRRHKKDYKKKVYDQIERELGFTIPKAKSIYTKEYNFSNLRFLETIGEGAFGKVMKAEAPGLKTPHGTQTAVAVKICRDNDMDRNELLSEIDILMTLGVHQHVIPLLGVCTKGLQACLITQYMPDGDLQDYLRNSRSSFVGTYPFKPQTADSFQININKVSNICTSDDSLTSRDLISFARQIACGMEYVSSQKIVHRDLAARNVLVASKRSLKITDFGLARRMTGVNEEYVMGPNRKVPYRWLAPESFFQKVFTVYSDVWAFGVLLYEILTLGGSPYPRHTIRDIPGMLKQGYRMSPPTNSKPELNQLMSFCWHQVPETRPSFSKIMEHLDELLGTRPEEYLDCGDPQADIVPNLNSNDNQEMDPAVLQRYSVLSGDVSIAAQGYDRIADAHSAFNTIDNNGQSFTMSPLLSEIKSNPIPETYQHLPIVEPTDRKNSACSAQYVNHDTGMPVIVNQDFVCGTENFVAQKL